VGNVTWVLQQILYAFQQCKNFVNWSRFDKVRDFKGGNFFETQCRSKKTIKITAII